MCLCRCMNKPQCARGSHQTIWSVCSSLLLRLRPSHLLAFKTVLFACFCVCPSSWVVTFQGFSCSHLHSQKRIALVRDTCCHAWLHVDSENQTPEDFTMYFQDKYFTYSLQAQGLNVFTFKCFSSICNCKDFSLSFFSPWSWGLNPRHPPLS